MKVGRLMKVLQNKQKVKITELESLINKMEGRGMISISKYATVKNLPKYEDLERFESNKKDIIYIQYDVFGKNKKYSMEIYNRKFVMKFFVGGLKEDDFLFGDTLIEVKEEIRSQGKVESIELYKGALTKENYKQVCQILKKAEPGMEKNEQTTLEGTIKQYGWVCPKCGAVMAPHQNSCVYCMPQTRITNGTENDKTEIFMDTNINKCIS